MNQLIISLFVVVAPIAIVACIVGQPETHVGLWSYCCDLS